SGRARESDGSGGESWFQHGAASFMRGMTGGFQQASWRSSGKNGRTECLGLPLPLPWGKGLAGRFRAWGRPPHPALHADLSPEGRGEVAEDVGQKLRPRN